MSASSSSSEHVRGGLGHFKDDSSSAASSSSEDGHPDRTGVPSTFGGSKARVRKRRRLNTEIAFPAFDNSAAKSGNWERHTRGIGSKILAKHGFTGRLGRNQAGIAKPIEPVFLPEKAGLGSTLPIPSKKPQAAPEKKETVQTRNPLWQQHAVPKRASLSANMKVMDMRHQVPVEVASVAEALRNNISVAEKPVWEQSSRTPHLRLLGSLRSLTDNARAKAAAVASKKHAETLIIESIRAERRRATAKRSRLETERIALQKLQQTLRQLQTAVEKQFMKEAERAMYMLVQLVSQFSESSHIKQTLIVAAIFDASSKAVQQSFQLCIRRSVESATADKLRARHMNAMLSIAQEALGHDEFVRLCTRSILVPARRHISRPDWDVISGSCLGDVLAKVRNTVPDVLLQTLGEQVVAPQLVVALRRLGAKGEPFVVVTEHAEKGKRIIPAHLWIHPWLPVVGRQPLAEVLQLVRIDLTKSLQEWKVNEVDARRERLISATKLWSEVLSRRKLQIVLSRHVSSKLSASLRNVKTTPSDCEEARAVFSSLAVWSKVISSRLLAADIVDAFLQGPGAALQQVALSSSSDVEKCGWRRAAQLYMAWSQALSPRLKEQLQAALGALLFVIHAGRVVVDDERMRDILRRADLKVLLKNRFAIDASAKKRTKDRAAQTPSSSAASGAANVHDARSSKGRLIDVISLVAQREQLVLHELAEEGGMRVFQLGKVKVISDVREGVLRVAGRAVSVDELIARASGRPFK